VFAPRRHGWSLPRVLADRLAGRDRGEASTRREGPQAEESAPSVAAWRLGDRLGVVRMRSGDLVFYDPHDKSLGIPVEQSGEWEPDVTLVLKRLLQPGARVIDVGSNIGCHVVTMARAIGDGGSLLAIEAHPDVADLLRCTVAANHLRHVRIIQAAVLDRSGEVELFARDDDLGGGAVGLPGWQDDPWLREHRRHRVKAATLDDLAADIDRADLIHMDVEGCELAILAGAQQLLSRSPEVKIVCEWGAYHAPSYFDIEAGLDRLIAGDFSFWRIAPDGSLLPQTREQMLAREFCDVVMARQELG